MQKTAPLRDSGMDVRRTESNPLLEVSGEHTHAPIDTPVDATADPGMCPSSFLN